MLNFAPIRRDTIQSVTVPIVPALDFVPEDLDFRLRSLVDNRSVPMDLALDMDVSANYVRISVLFNDDCPDGSYAYKLTLYGPEGERREVVSEGLATVGDYKAPATAYNETIQFTQYAD